MIRKFNALATPDMRKLLKDSLWTFRGKVIHGILQAVYYILLARILGAEGFGVFAALMAFLGFFQPFLGVGSDSLLIREVARRPELAAGALGRSFMVYALSGIILFGLALGINFGMFAESFTLVLIANVIVAEFLFRIADQCARAFQAFERLNAASKLWVLASLFKFLFVVLFMMTASDPTVEKWSWYYLCSAVTALVLTLGLTFWYLGLPSLAYPAGEKFFDLTEGLAFSVSHVTEKIYSDVDKFMLLKLSAPYAAGIYSAAYQFLKAGYYPIQSLLVAAYPRFFKKGAGGMGEVQHFLRNILKYSGSLGLLASVGLFLAAPLAPLMLGQEYAETAQVLRWISVVPLLQSVYIAFADALSGADLQKVRSGIQLLVVGLNVGLNFWLIPIYSWWGAVVATIISESALLVLFSTTFFWYRKNGTQTGGKKN